MTTTNPSLAIDNDNERRHRAAAVAEAAVNAAFAEMEKQRQALEAENARLRAALTEAERQKHFVGREAEGLQQSLDEINEVLGYNDEPPRDGEETVEAVAALTRELAESERARAILAKQLDEECARLPRLRQEQTAEIERLHKALAKAERFNDSHGIVMAVDQSEQLRAENELLRARLDEEMKNAYSLQGAQTARIAELEAEVTKLKAAWSPKFPVPAPAAPAVPVVEVGSRWRRVTAGYDVEVIGVDDKHVHWDSLVNGSKWTNERAWFLERFTRLPDEPAGGGEP